jgi:hypothetical protein
MTPDAFDQYRQPEYTGENRCLPCTAVNGTIAVLLAMLASFFGTPVLGLLVLAGSLLAIYLRGYLVPGTPELTRKYLPDWVLARFDKAEGPPTEPNPSAAPATADAPTGAYDADAEPDAVEAASGAADAQPSPVDPEALLFEMDAVEESADGEEIVLTDPFADELLAAAEARRDDEAARTTAVASLLGVDVDDATIDQEVHGPALYADSERIHRWPSEAALLADAGVHDALAGREGWVGTNPQQRLGICRALRSFLTSCPVCGGDVGLTEETVESCCRAWAVFAVRCDDCEAHFLELEPEEADQPSETVVEESEGARGVSGGFTR